MQLKLAHCKQTVDGETKHNKKKMKMASARKPESFVWTNNEVEGWGDGVIDTGSMQICCPHKNATAAFSDFSHPETRFQKSAFTGTAFIGSMWMIGQNNAKHAHLDKRGFPCGRP